MDRISSLVTLGFSFYYIGAHECPLHNRLVRLMSSSPRSKLFTKIPHFLVEKCQGELKVMNLENIKTNCLDIPKEFSEVLSDSKLD